MTYPPQYTWRAEPSTFLFSLTANNYLALLATLAERLDIDEEPPRRKIVAVLRRAMPTGGDGRLYIRAPCMRA